MLDIVNETREFLEDQLVSHLHRFIPTTQSFKSDEVPKVGDIVIFVMKDNQRKRNITWKFGRISETYVDGRAGKVRICYKNADECVFREVARNVSDVCIIDSIDDIEFNTEQHRKAFNFF